MKVIVDIFEDIFENIENGHSRLATALWLMAHLREKSKILNDMTNGEVIKFMFPNAEFVCGDYGISTFYMRMHNDVGIASLDKSWWNAPYKKGTE